MKGVLVPLMCLAILHAHAEPSPNQYGAIEKRNAFGLKEKAPPVPEQKEKPLASAKVVLNGITTILGARQALLQVIPPQPKPGEEPESLILAEGQSQGPIKVLRINEEEGWVRVANAGIETTIRFEDPPPAAVAAAGATNNPGLASRAFPTNTLAGAPGLTPPLPETRQYPTRTPRTTGLVPPLNTTSTSSITTTVSPLPTTPTTSSTTTSQQLTPEEQNALLQIEQQLQRDQAPQPQQPQQPQQVEVPPPAGANQPYIYNQPPLAPPRPPFQPNGTFSQ